MIWQDFLTRKTNKQINTTVPLVSPSIQRLTYLKRTATDLFFNFFYSSQQKQKIGKVQNAVVF